MEWQSSTIMTMPAALSLPLLHQEDTVTLKTEKAGIYDVPRALGWGRQPCWTQFPASCCHSGNIWILKSTDHYLNKILSMIYNSSFSLISAPSLTIWWAPPLPFYSHLPRSQEPSRKTVLLSYCLTVGWSSCYSDFEKFKSLPLRNN